MRIAVIGSGGREHAIIWKLRENENIKEIYALPGNAGIGQVARCVDISVEDISGICEFSKRNNIDMVVVGPEVPLGGEQSIHKGISETSQNPNSGV